MRKLRLRCPSCGEVTLATSDLFVSGLADADRVTCSFRCPECGVDHEQECDIMTGRLLLLNGAQVKRAAPAAPPLGLADLESLRELMERPDFVKLMRKAS